ncbi:OmpP1/FadL family transporter [Luteimonas panaciterrae]|uniref:OmpP1/FadL family transporter n=1 Tax=Luteimonas panaciterrae TaxID=363885 RepID=UPI001CFBA848|nr:outer membrane protein transport protein [Luteimonas panaciterrae]
MQTSAFLPRRKGARGLGILALAMASLPFSAFATNGYFSNGPSVKSNGLGGAGTAFPVDSLAGFINPAGILFVGDRVDVGLTVFRPDRSSTIEGNAFGADGEYSGNAREYFLLPEAGHTHRINDDVSFGLSLTGNGGMNTDYRRNPYRAFGGRGSAGVNLQQIFLTPSLAFRVGEQQSIGIGLNFAVQRFYAKGLEGFAGASLAPDRLTGNDYSTSTGVGVRLGWTGRFLDERLSFGATWASKIEGHFDDYEGLFAENGGFDIPQNASIGAAFRANDKLTLLADVQRIYYSKTKSVGNSLAPLLQGQPLGGKQGPGFGWRDIDVYKIAASYDYSPRLTLRAGFSHAEQPIPDDQTFFNILAPGAVQDQLSLGATWQTGERGEFSIYYSHAFEKEVNGRGSIPQPFGGGEADIQLSEDSLGFAYAWKL